VVNPVILGQTLPSAGTVDRTLAPMAGHGTPVSSIAALRMVSPTPEDCQVILNVPESVALVSGTEKQFCPAPGVYVAVDEILPLAKVPLVTLPLAVAAPEFSTVL